MLFGIINPRAQTITHCDCFGLEHAQRLAHLDKNKVDHGIIKSHLAYVVYELANFVPPENQAYFAMCGKLIAGNCVLYAFGEYGETRDLTEVPALVWLPTRDHVEAAITLKRVARPTMSLNGELLWSWPQQAPPNLLAAMVRQGLKDE